MIASVIRQAGSKNDGIVKKNLSLSGQILDAGCSMLDKARIFVVIMGDYTLKHIAIRWLMLVIFIVTTQSPVAARMMRLSTDEVTVHHEPQLKKGGP